MKQKLIQKLGVWVGLLAMPWVGATEWIRPGSGDWSDPSNWSAGLPGNTGVEVVVPGEPGRRVTVTAGASDASLRLPRLRLGGGTGGAVVLRLDGLGPRPMRLSDSLNVFDGGTVEIRGSELEMDGSLTGGGFHLNDGSLVLDSGAWRVTAATTRIGRVGVGVASIRNGSFQAGGDVLVGDLPGSSGELRLEGGSTVIDGILYIADDPGSTGALRVQGGNLSVGGRHLRVGDDGVGRMDLLSGAVVAPNVSVGRGSGAVGELHVAGGTMRCGDLSLGRFAGARGVAVVSGGELSVGLDTLWVGREGEGELTVTGGEVTAGELVGAAVDGALGRLTVSGGRVRLGMLRMERGGAGVSVTGGVLEVGSSVVRTGQPLVVGDGVHPAVLRLAGGTHVFADGLVIEAGSRLEGSGTVEGQVTIRGIDARDRVGTGPVPPSLRLVRGAAGWEVEFESVVGVTYFLEATEGGVAGAWAGVGAGVVGPGGLMRLAAPQGPEVRVFRVRAEGR